MFRLLLIFIVAMVLVTIVWGQDAPLSPDQFPNNYLPEDFIYEVVEEAPALPSINTTNNPVTINVNDLPRTGNTALPAAGATPAQNRGIFNQTTGASSTVTNRLIPNSIQTEDAVFNPQTTPLFGVPLPQTQAVTPTLPTASQPTFIPPSAIASEELSFNPKTANNFGLIDTTNNGFNANLWQGLTAKRAEELITPLLTPQTHNMWAQNTLQRLLLTRATAPISNTSSTSWLSARAHKLIQLGQSEDAYNLIRQVPKTELNTDANLAETWVSTQLLAGKTTNACPIVKNQVKNNDAEFWQNHLILCQLLQNETQKLNLSLAALSAENLPKNTSLFTLINATQDPSPTSALSKNNTQPNYFNTPEATILASYPSFYTQVSAATPIQNLALARIIKSNKLPLKLRLQAAENLANKTNNRQHIEQLKNLYKTAQFTPQQVTDPLGNSQTQPSTSMARALLFQASQLAPQTSLRASSQDALYTSLNTDNLHHLNPNFTATTNILTPSPELAWLAPKMIRYALENQDINRAQAWLSALNQNTTLSPELAQKRTTLTLAIAIYNQANITIPLTSWLANQTAHSALQTQQILSSIDALGLNVPSEVWQSVAGQLTNLQSTSTSTGPLWLRLVADALQNERQAEVLLLLMQPLSTTALTDLAPLTLANIVTALGYLNMQEDARNLTLQILLQNI